MSLKESFAKTKVKVLPGDFFIVQISLIYEKNVDDALRKLRGFYSLTFDDEEITLILSEEDWKKIYYLFKEARIEKPYKVITLDTILEWDVIGYVATVSKILAKENISIGVVSSFSRDHVLVEKSDLKKAVSLIKNYIKKCKK